MTYVLVGAAMTIAGIVIYMAATEETPITAPPPAPKPYVSPYLSSPNTNGLDAAYALKTGIQIAQVIISAAI